MRNTILIGSFLLASLVGAGCSSAQSASTPAAVTPVPNTPAANQPQAQVPAQSAQTYTLDEVAKHGTASDCWMAYKGRVYDVTKYIPNHPAGDKILFGCGKDATSMFDNIKDGKGHSDFAKSLFTDYLKGDLKQ